MDCKDCNEICSCNECKRPHECACTCKYEFELKNVNECVNEVTKEEMLEQLKCYKFAIIELGLYLDTHPDDEKAICLHNEYARRYRELSNQYQKVYGPLTIMFPCKKWRWLEEPWPWEGGEC